MSNIKIKTGQVDEFMLGNQPIERKKRNHPQKNFVRDKGVLSSYQVTKLNKNQKERINDYLIRSGRKTT